MNAGRTILIKWARAMDALHIAHANATNLGQSVQQRKRRAWAMNKSLFWVLRWGRTYGAGLRWYPKALWKWFKTAQGGEKEVQ